MVIYNHQTSQEGKKKRNKVCAGKDAHYPGKTETSFEFIRPVFIKPYVNNN
jgi:hypothetical protein